MPAGGARFSLGFRLIVIALVSILPVLGVSAYDALELRRRAGEDALRDLGSSLDALCSRQTLLLENTRLLLKALARTDMARRPEPGALRELFAGIRQDNPLYLAILAFEPSGEMIAASSDSPPVSVADRAYFREAVRSGAFAVGEYAIGRTTGRPTIHFAYPVRAPAGALACVLVASYDLDYYGRLFGADLMNPGSVIEVFDREGVRLFRFPGKAGEEAGAPGGEAVLRLARLGPVNAMRISSSDYPGQVSASRALSFGASGAADFLVTIRYPRGVALARSRAITDRSVAMILCSLLISLVLLRVLAHFVVGAQLKRLVGAAGRIGAGDYSPRPGARIGTAEFALLGASLDELAGRLLRRERERDEAEAALRASLAEKDILLKEIHHRVKNNFQIVSSLLSLQAGTMRDEEAIEAYEISQSRIKSMALIHEKLYRSESLQRIDFADYLRSMAEEIASAYYEASARVRLRFELEPVELPIDAAIPLGLIMNEILVNSYKYAFPEGRPGNILLRMARADRDGRKRARLEARDDGIGFDAEKARPGSLGLELVRGLAAQLKGELSFDGAGGAAYVLDFPLEP